MSRGKRALTLFPIAGVAIALIPLNLQCAGDLRIEPLGRTDRPLVVDEHLDLARAFAPWVYHEIHPRRGRQDLPTRVDFDGDLVGVNNWENFLHFELPPTLYYAALETETHYFIAYHMFHPRDWQHVRFGLHGTHENDGENLQVVVDKESREVVLLFTQAHYDGEAHLRPGMGVSGGGRFVGEDVVLVDDEGRPSDEGRHACVFVEAFGHGIYGLADRAVDVSLGGDGDAVFKRSGIVFRPARPGEVAREPTPRKQTFASGSVVPYRLESTAAKLWPGVRDGSLVGEGGIVDGAVQFESAVVTAMVPRYYEGDRFSGPFGPDRGISPFAVDFEFEAGTVGALFFDPAPRYAECFEIVGPWSLEYVDYPFGSE